MKLLLCLLAAISAAQAAFWMQDIQHNGVAPFNPSRLGYQVFRNVKDFGAVGDGVHDDTDAINAAISRGDRVGGFVENHASSTTSPAVVYFPAGTYLVSSSIIGYYYTQYIGDANDMPVIKAAVNFTQGNLTALLDIDPYAGYNPVTGAGILEWISTNMFYMQLRNLAFDLTDVQTPGVHAVHWPSAQATSIQNCVFNLSSDTALAQTGIYMEEGSGGLMVDLIFNGGQYGAQFGNQQFTMRNLTFNGCETAILHSWDWGWTYRSLQINDCRVGLNISVQDMGSIAVLDSNFTNVDTAIISVRNITNNTSTMGSLVLENVAFTGVTNLITGPEDENFGQPDNNGITPYAGYVMGNIFTPLSTTESTVARANPSWFPSLSALKHSKTDGFRAVSKPQYESYNVSNVLTARSYDATGDGETDDTAALNNLFRAASNSSSIAFVDAGYYKVTDTVYVPPNTRIVGEALASIIMGSGANFSDTNRPYPVVQIGYPGSTGFVQMSDILVSTQGSAPGAVLIEYNLDNTAATGPPSGLWDVHTRIGGYIGSNLQLQQCPKIPMQNNSVVKQSCIGAYMSMHITRTAANLYLENNWLWTADHDIDDTNNTQISVFAGRGLLVESETGSIWLSGTAVEHHTLYQYQLAGTQNIWMGHIQTETPYYQPNPPAPYPFTPNASISDPEFATDCSDAASVQNGTSLPCNMAWGLRIVDSQNVAIYGASLYSFFQNYNLCPSPGNCQARIFDICSSQTSTGAGTDWNATGTNVPQNAGEATSNVIVYDLNILGSGSMVTREGQDVVWTNDNMATSAGTLALFQY